MSGASTDRRDEGARQRGFSVIPILITLATVAVAGFLGWQAWRYYMGSPWTRDGAVRAYVVKIASQVAGQIVELPVADNALVRKGDLLMLVDPTDYTIAVRQAEAAVAQARALASNAHAEMARRQQLTQLEVTTEEVQTYVSKSESAEAAYQSALASLQQAHTNLQRTEIRSPVNGYVTNLRAHLGDFAAVGQQQISLVDADSFWVDAYFEETALHAIRIGDAATIKLMGYRPLLGGVVEGIARGVEAPNATTNASGLAAVNPIFTFVRLAQRVPVRIRIAETPKGIELVAGMTATVQIEPRSAEAPAAPVGKPLAEKAPEIGAAPIAALPPKIVPPSATPAVEPAGSPARREAAAASVPPPPPAPVPDGSGAPQPARSPASEGRRLVEVEGMAPSQYLGKTINLFAQPSSNATARQHGAPGALRWRAHPYRRRYE